jgi:hypothetical protein
MMRQAVIGQAVEGTTLSHAATPQLCALPTAGVPGIRNQYLVKQVQVISCRFFVIHLCVICDIYL